MAITVDVPSAADIGLFEPVITAGGRDVAGSRWLRRALVAGDGIALLCGSLLASATAVAAFGGVYDRATAARAAGAVIVGVWLLHRQGLYLSRVASMRTVESAGIARTTMALGVLTLVVDQALVAAPGWYLTALGGVLTLLLLTGWRTAYRDWLRAQRRRGRFTNSVVLVGIDDQTRELSDLLDDHDDLGLTLVGVVGDRAQAERNGLLPMWRGPLSSSLEAIDAGGASGAIVSATALAPDDLNATVRLLLERGCHVHVSSGVRGIDHRRMRSVHVGYEPLVYVEPAAAFPPRQLALKRALDVGLSALGLLVVLPMLAVAAVAIKLSDGGPILFRQTRVGRGGSPFHLYKLRTMRLHAEDQLEGLRALNERTGPLFKMREDPRVTRVGRVLRNLSIDELPQLWNVLRGDMSLVGPRPALPTEMAQFDHRLRQRANVLPGITGLWQVEARDNPSFRAYERLDLFYLENWSLTLDMMILLTTVVSQLSGVLSQVVRRRGRRPEPVGAPPQLTAVPTEVSGSYS